MLAGAHTAGLHRSGWGMYVLVREADGLVVGGMGFHGPPQDAAAEIGFDLHPDARATATRPRHWPRSPTGHSSSPAWTRSSARPPRTTCPPSGSWNAPASSAARTATASSSTPSPADRDHSTRRHRTAVPCGAPSRIPTRRGGREKPRHLVKTAPPPTAPPTRAPADALAQPYGYRRHEAVEPDWRRFPGWRDVTSAQWRDPQWQRAHCVKESASCANSPARGSTTPSTRTSPPTRSSSRRCRSCSPRRSSTPSPRPPPPAPPTGTPTPCAATCCRWPATGTRAGRATPSPPATRCTRPRCGSSKDSPTATRPRCSPNSSPPARSTAGTAPAWTSSAPPPRRSTSTASCCGPRTASTA